MKLLLAILLGAGTLAAAEFERDIRPLLRARCVECHGPGKQKGGLRLDARSLAFKGGEHGAVIQPGRSADSRMIARVTSTDAAERMPPKGDPLTPAQVAALRDWMEGGAVWIETDEDRAAARPPGLDHWAWQPVRRPTVPGAGNPIDAFIAAKLAGSGLAPSPEADRRTLIRRLTFDLHGLPPTPEQVAEFVADEDPRAYEKLVDRLLASPHYGERWARHWLDISHYADTHGFERDQRRDHAWRYRDWVIRALNADRPYNAFLRDQLAGDVLRPGDPEAVAATGFLAAGPWDFVGQAETPSPVLKRLARADDLDDMLTQVMTAACGVTVNCARCHDHKLDPISQREYYALSAVFAGVKRGDRDVDPGEGRRLAEQRRRLSNEVFQIRTQLAALENRGLDLADMIGGGNGTGTGTKGGGIHVATGKPQADRLGKVEAAKANVLSKVAGGFVDSVVIPDGGGGMEVPVSTTGLKVRGVPKTSGGAWDAIRNGPVNAQKATAIGDVDFNTGGHSLLGLHANAAVTFKLAPMRAALKAGGLRLRADVGYGGRPETDTAADVRIFVDGELAVLIEGLGPKSGRHYVNLVLPESARFLTLMATEGRDDIGFDQVFFGDPRVAAADPVALTAEEISRRDALQARLGDLERQLKSLTAPAKVYAVLSEPPPVVRVLHRGDPEQPRDDVAPGALSLAPGLNPGLAAAKSAEGERRVALADWITAPANPLTRRVIVNRLWHHHFGIGLVDTPSDLGIGGGRPTHPELLDWLAEEFAARGWSLKAMHRLICSSATYRQQSAPAGPGADKARSLDAGNRLLWRMTPRRLDAESLRDAVLLVSGKLNREMFGPGYRDFNYREEYAPVYTYVTQDRPELWRRSVYRFVVRTTTQPFLTTLDCPNPANLTPSRNVTTTALQSLALLNNDFMQQQAARFAERVQAEAGDDPSNQVSRAFRLALARPPAPAEREAALALTGAHGLVQLCRMLLNSGEFVYVD